MTDPKVTPPMSAKEWYNANLHKHVTWVSMLEAYVDYCSKADAEKVACQEKALKIAIDATVVMREKIERLEKRLEDCNKGYTMASQIAAKTAKKYLDAEEKIAALGAENKELQQALRDCS